MAIIKAIELAWVRDWKHIWLEVDSSLVLDYIRRPSLVPWPLRVRWLNCLYRISKMNFKATHIFREGNKIVDALANQVILEGCTNISEIDDSIGELEKLVFLNVTDCKNLKKLPETIDRLTSLQELNLSGCSNLSLHANTATDLRNFFILVCMNVVYSAFSFMETRFLIGTSTAMSIIVPSHPKLKITGLNVCVVYTRRGKIEDICTSPIVKASNEAKGVMWSYCPVSVGLPKENEKMSWLSHWQFENDELECGEELRVSVDTDYMYVPILIKELAVQLVYEHKHEHDENEGKACNGMQLSDHDVGVATQHEAPYWSQGVLIGHVSAPKYQIWPGTYFLRNHHNVVYHIPVERPAGNMRIFEHHRFDEMRVLGQKNLL
uniref:uncharacterized protein LOC105350053 n=1 Tax=Fragaria vesca subsp. vesca TaxID=101020 RepID=UPI0005CAE1EE|nr:PREDICTED: uncharacterized protein LOC105350053 [Fragaria vesca subsp. vesca]